MAFQDFRSRDAEEIQNLLGLLYPESTFRFVEKGTHNRLRSFGYDFGDVAQFNTSYSSPFVFRSEMPRDSIAIHTCMMGSERYHIDGRTVDWESGSAGPMPMPTDEFRVETGPELSQIYTHFSSNLVEYVCIQRIGRPLDEPLILEVRPFSKELTALWMPVVWSLDQILQSDEPLEIALHNLTEYAIALFLQMHQHNYSEHFERKRALSDQDIRKAQIYIMENADRPLTPTDIANYIGASTYALHTAFCEKLGAPSRVVLYWARMSHARRALMGNTDTADELPPGIARHYGFIELDRFARRYRTRYGEYPIETYRRSHSHLLTSDGDTKHVLAPAKVEMLRHKIHASLGNPPSVGELAKLVGMNRSTFSGAFKNTLGVAPGQYILSERLNWARWLLAHTDDSIAAIATETGFSSQAHLTTALRTHEGLTPKQIRKLYT